MKAIMFDFDGVLVNTKEFILDFFKDIGIVYEDYDEFAKDYHNGYIDFLKKHGFTLDDIKEQEQKFKKLQEKRISKIKLFPGVKEMLEKLSKDYKLGIVTMNYENIVRQVLKNNDAEQFFSVIVDQTKGSKPNAEPVLYCLNALGVKAEEAVFVGDEKVDIKAARAANVRIIASLYGLHTKDLLKDADDFIEKPEELILKLN